MLKREGEAVRGCSQHWSVLKQQCALEERSRCMNTNPGKDPCYLIDLTVNVQGYRLFIPRGLGQLQVHAISP